ncbi:MAG: M15 family metallopeptidase [Patescibacteria group bacterium]
MKILIISLLTLFSLTPSLALADAGGAGQGVIDNGEIDACSSFNCACSWRGNFLGNDPEPTSAMECTSSCLGIIAIYNSGGDPMIDSEIDADYQCLGEGGQVINDFSRLPPASTPIRDPLIPNLNVKIPGLCDEKGECWKDVTNDILDGVYTSNLLGSYIKAVYGYLLLAGSIIATTMLMIAGLQYATARGDTHQVETAKKRIGNAVVGVIILLLAYNIAFIINPSTTTFNSLSLRTVPKLPPENQFSPIGSEAIACTASGKDLYGVNDFQDCMLDTYGAYEIDVELVNIEYRGRTYQVNALAAKDFAAAFQAIEDSGVDYDITVDPAGGTFNWRCNKNAPQALSPHSWGTAIDINPAQNPNCPVGCQDTDGATSCSCVSEPGCVQQCQTKTYDLPQEVIDAFENNGFAWGGDWTRAVDYMHFTYIRGCGGG